MDGNFGPGGITEDLQAMKRVGLGGLIFMEVDVGIPKGNVAFMSPPWREHSQGQPGGGPPRPGDHHARQPRLDRTGGPWVKPEQSMQKLVASEQL